MGFLADTDAKLASTPAALGAASDVVGICVVADADVEDVLLGSDGVLAGMAPGGIVAIHSTMHPETCARVAQRASEAGISVVDAPVSGGGMMAAARNLLVMVGGDESISCPLPARCSRPSAIRSSTWARSGAGSWRSCSTTWCSPRRSPWRWKASPSPTTSPSSAVPWLMCWLMAAEVAGPMAILAATGFDLTGLRGAVGLLRKDVEIMLDVARNRGAAEPEPVVGLARRTLATLDEP